jgi:hypothetical protein
LTGAPRPLCRYYLGCSPGGSCCHWLAATLQRHAGGTRLLLGQTLRVAAGMLAPLSEARPAAVLSGALAAHYPGSILAKWDNAQMTAGQTQALVRDALPGAQAPHAPPGPASGPHGTTAGPPCPA